MRREDVTCFLARARACDRFGISPYLWNDGRGTVREDLFHCGKKTGS
ncbi:MAG: hypothetical protein M0Z41_01695 [Peptococcaceae bacterium]|nr:hypothetical protein [Peptococcaceae bacterium]